MFLVLSRLFNNFLEKLVMDSVKLLTLTRCLIMCVSRAEWPNKRIYGHEWCCLYIECPLLDFKLCSCKKKILYILQYFYRTILTSVKSRSNISWNKEFLYLFHSKKKNWVKPKIHKANVANVSILFKRQLLKTIN